MCQNIHISEQPSAKIIAPEGDLDATLATHLEAVLSQYNLSHEKCLINLEKVTTINADGVRVLLNAYVHSKDTGNLSLRNPNAEVKKFLTTVGLAELITD